MRKNPERYRDILEDRKQLRDQKKKARGDKAKSRSTSRSRRTQQVTVAPRVSLRSSSEDEADLADDEPDKQQQQQQEDEERRIIELNTLKRLQSGLAAKAREALEKKASSPSKIKIDRREESSVLDIALPSEPPKNTAQNTVMLPRDRSESREPIIMQALPAVQSPVSSRSPSPALPLTREEAAIKIRSPSESPPPPSIPQQSFDRIDSASPSVKMKTNLSSRSPSTTITKKDLSPVVSSKKDATKSESSSHSPTAPMMMMSREDNAMIKLRSPSESPPPLPNASLARSDQRLKSPKKSKLYSRSASRSCTRSPSVTGKVRSSRSPSRDKKSSVSPGRRSVSHAKKSSPKAKAKQQQRSSRSRSSSAESKRTSASRSPSRCKKSASRSRSRNRSTSKRRSRSRSSVSLKKSRSRSLSKKRSRSRSLSKKSKSRSRSASRTSRDKDKRSRTRSSSRSSVR